MEKYHVECACEALQHHLCVHLFANVLALSRIDMDTCIISPFKVTEPVFNSGKKQKPNVISTSRHVISLGGLKERDTGFCMCVKGF